MGIWVSDDTEEGGEVHGFSLAEGQWAGGGHAPHDSLFTDHVRWVGCWWQQQQVHTADHALQPHCMLPQGTHTPVGTVLTSTLWAGGDLMRVHGCLAGSYTHVSMQQRAVGVCFACMHMARGLALYAQFGAGAGGGL